MDGASASATRTFPIVPRDRVSAGRALGLFLTAGGLFSLWPVVFAASYLDRRRNILVLSTVVVAEGIVMGVLETPSEAVVDASALALAFTLTALAILAQRRRVDGLVAALESQAREDPVTGLPNRRAF